MLLGNYRLVKIDKYNIVVEEYKEITKKDGSKINEWVQISGYYSTIEMALRFLKNYIISNSLNGSKAEDVLKLINDLSTAYLNCYIKLKEE